MPTELLYGIIFGVVLATGVGALVATLYAVSAWCLWQAGAQVIATTTSIKLYQQWRSFRLALSWQSGGPLQFGIALGA